MRALIQRVSCASVRVAGEVVSRVGHGLVVFLGVASEDGTAEADWISDKLVNVRVFEDEEGKFDASVIDVGGEVLVVSQFTLYGDTTRGRRPSFTEAAPPEKEEILYRRVADRIEQNGIRVSRGRFGAHMQVDLVNDGPVTLMLDSAARRGAWGTGLGA